MDWIVEFECRKCMADFECQWSFGDEVTCPNCKTVWETDWDYDSEDNIMEPWLGNKVETPPAPPEPTPDRSKV